MEHSTLRSDSCLAESFIINLLLSHVELDLELLLYLSQIREEWLVRNVLCLGFVIVTVDRLEHIQ